MVATEVTSTPCPLPGGSTPCPPRSSTKRLDDDQGTPARSSPAVSRLGRLDQSDQVVASLTARPSPAARGRPARTRAAAAAVLEVRARAAGGRSQLVRRPSKSSRQCAPRDSSRNRAEATTAVATVIRFVASQVATPGCDAVAPVSRARSAAQRSSPAGIAQPAGVAAHRLLHRGHHRPVDQARPPARRPPAAPERRRVGRAAGRRSAGRRPAPPAASSTPAGWRRARRRRRPHRRRTARPGWSPRRDRSRSRRRSSGRPATTGIRSTAGSIPARRQLCRIVGNRTRQVSSPSIRPST